jgi:dCMP deaminase
MLSVAQVVSRRSTCPCRISVGAVITVDKRIIATGFNGSPQGMPHCTEIGCLLDEGNHCIRSIHAEENAILQCAIMGTSPVGGILYTTHSPCYHCAKQIQQVGIRIVVYIDQYGSIIDIENVARFFSQANINLIHWDM